MHDTLSLALSNVMNAEKIGRGFCTAKPFSKLLKDALTIMQDKGYLGAFEIIEDGKGKIVKINLIGKINKCGAIKPRFSVRKDEFEKFEKRYLPAKDFGLLIVSTSKGLMTHIDAKEKKMGGKLIAYVY